ncbi:MAG: hypothetical protein ACLFVL_07850 [Candidatus Aenigmatarchaeota archaeon]
MEDAVFDPKDDILVELASADPRERTERFRREKVLEKIHSDRRKRIDYLLDFDPETAAGLMDLAYITVDKDASFAQVAERVRRFEKGGINSRPYSCSTRGPCWESCQDMHYLWPILQRKI